MSGEEMVDFGRSSFTWLGDRRETETRGPEEDAVSFANDGRACGDYDGGACLDL
jgi:hypothetical protein